VPYTKKAHEYFEAVAHGMKPRKGKLSKHMAMKMASEGVKGGDTDMEEKKFRMKHRAYTG